MNTLFTGGSKRRLRKGVALIGLSLSLPLIALGTAAPSGAAAGADVPFAGGLFASGASYEDTSSTLFDSLNEDTLLPTDFGDANETLPDGKRSFDGLAYNPVNDYLYTTTDDGKSADLSVICNAPLIQYICNFDDSEQQTLTAAAPAGAPSAADSIATLDAVTNGLIAQIAATPVPAAVAVPEPIYGTLHNAVPGEPDLYRLDSEGDLDFVGRIPAPAEPAIPVTPGIGLSHSAALGFAASSAADGTYLIPGIQLRASLDIEALLDRINGDDNDGLIDAQALASITSPFIDLLLPELVIEAGLSVGHVDPATAATTYVDVDLSADSCLGVNTYAAAGQLSNILTNLVFGPNGPATPELLGGGLLDWAVNPSNGLLYSYVTPGLLGLLYPDAPDAIVLTINPATGAAVCTPIGTAAASVSDIIDLIDDGGDFGDLIDLLAPIFFPVGGDAFLSNGDLLLWATTLQNQLLVVPAATLATCIGGGSCADLATASDPTLDALVIGDLASNPFPDLTITPTTSTGTPATPFGFTISDGGYDAVQLVKDQMGTYQAIPTKTPLTITDAVPAGFDLVKVTCSIDGATVTPAITADSVTITVNTAADASCVFLHDPEPVIVIKVPELAATGPQDSLRLSVLGIGLMAGGAALSIMTRRRERV